MFQPHLSEELCENPVLGVERVEGGAVDVGGVGGPRGVGDGVFAEGGEVAGEGIHGRPGRKRRRQRGKVGGMR